MCGRYTIFTDSDERELFEILQSATLKYGDGSFMTGEIFPAYNVPVLTVPSFRAPEVFKWGYPKPGKGSGIIINARAESALIKPLFGESLTLRRCIIPSTGFYEWDKDKTRYYFGMPDSSSRMLYMAGLYNIYEGRGHFVILTTAANRSVSGIHDRMPLILRRDMLRDWLCDTEKALNLLKLEPPEVSAVIS